MVTNLRGYCRRPCSQGPSGMSICITRVDPQQPRLLFFRYTKDSITVTSQRIIGLYLSSGEERTIYWRSDLKLKEVPPTGSRVLMTRQSCGWELDPSDAPHEFSLREDLAESETTAASAVVCDPYTTGFVLANAVRCAWNKRDPIHLLFRESSTFSHAHGSTVAVAPHQGVAART